MRGEPLEVQAATEEMPRVLKPGSEIVSLEDGTGECVIRRSEWR
jgi:hypothetical protein